jgi:hypothetical protein
VGSSSTSNSVPFTGNALALHGRAPFIATYTVTATSATGKNVNNLSSTSTAVAGTLGGATTSGATTSSTTLGGTTGGATLGSGGGSTGSGGDGGSRRG